MLLLLRRTTAATRRPTYVPTMALLAGVRRRRMCSDRRSSTR